MQSLSPVNVTSTRQEMQMFDLLRSVTVCQVTGGFDNSFWGVDFLQATQAYPAVWHAGLALSAMHQRMKITTSNDWALQTKHDYYIFALKQYNSAIKSLIEIAQTEHPSPAQQETLLMVSMLFAGICCLQGDPRQAVLHAKNAIHLFYEWKFWEYSDDRFNDRQGCVLSTSSLVTLITYFESQFINRLRNESRPPWRGKHLPQQCSAAPFTSVTEAYNEFQPLFNGLLETLLHIGYPSDQAAPRPKPNLIHLFRQEYGVWGEKFARFKKSRNAPPPDSEAMTILELYWVGIEISVIVDVDKAASSWDQFRPAYDRIITLAEQQFERELERNLSSHGAMEPIFCFSMSITEVLVFVGFNCRDGTIRRRVISLLRKWPRRDGLWDASAIASMCEAVMVLEEENAIKRKNSATAESGDDDDDVNCKCIRDEVICNDHRVVETKFDFLDNGGAQVGLRTVEDIRKGRPSRIVRL